MSSRRPIRYRTGAARRAHPRLGRYPYPIHLRARPRKRGGSRVIPILLTLGLAFVVFAGGTAGALGITAVGAVTALSEDLPDPAALGDLTFAQPTVVYDKSGEVELGRFQQELRWVVGYDEIPKLVLDATTTAEDRSFWENEGYDPAAILQAIGENVSGESERGASTITQQLVRARLLPEQYVQPGSDRYLRKMKELLQANRLTEAFPGEKGKQAIITAYLNEIFYGHDAYGIAAAARVYFGVKNLADLTPAQAALLAALPKSPTTMDPYRFARENAEGKLVVDPKSPPVVRRNYILSNLAGSRWTNLTRSQLRRAMAEPVILSGEEPLVFRAPHFTWQVRRQLVEILGSSEAVETGGYRVITSLDWKSQQLAERWLTAAVLVPNMPAERGNQVLTALKIPNSDRQWIRELRGKDLHNAALVAMDYKTGQVMAYAGSAGYYREDMASEKFEPKYDAAGDGERQPGSAWKPIVYATGFEKGILTPASLLLDITTEFDKRQEWAPRDADRLDRGPVLVRRALQYSLNVPAIRALQRIGNEAVAAQAEAMGIRFQGGNLAYLRSGLAGAIGTVEVRPLDLTAAYGALGNGGQYMAPQMIVQILDSKGNV
ncbi:MAG TPA: transglycosylase domain-containing protein, partial [Solirubrobacterales bacterium]|nr:transglycosylase domain-containing protein [Solirubrobacterales bacterium]